MRSTNEPQDSVLGGLGSPIRSEKPAPAPTPVSPGIVRNPDGTLATNAPPPPPTWVYTPPAAAPTAVTAPGVSDGQEADWEGLCAAERRQWHRTEALRYINQKIGDAKSAEERRGWSEAAEFLLKHGAP